MKIRGEEERVRFICESDWERQRLREVLAIFGEMDTLVVQGNEVFEKIILERQPGGVSMSR